MHTNKKNVLPLHSNYTNNVKTDEKNRNFNGRSFGRYISFRWWSFGVCTRTNRQSHRFASNQQAENFYYKLAKPLDS